MQPNSERNPVEEMLAAEDAGEFAYVPPEERTDSPAAEEEMQQEAPSSQPKVSSVYSPVFLLLLVLSHFEFAILHTCEGVFAVNVVN